MPMLVQKLPLLFISYCQPIDLPLQTTYKVPVYQSDSWLMMTMDNAIAVPFSCLFQQK
jgi:hypothetical protein